MSETSARLALPFLVPGQAQKEFFHNEALARIDMILCAAAESAGLTVPPVAPHPGQAWIAGAGASGAWSGHDHQLACWTENGWRFAAPVPGMAVWNKARALFTLWNGSGWTDGEVHASKVIIEGKQVIADRQAAIASPSGGATVDVEARQVIAAICAALKSHGLTE
jgi:hypothetical protein